MKPILTSKRNSVYLFICATLFVCFIVSCKKESTLTNSEKEILSISMRKADSTVIPTTDIQITIKNDSIIVVVPAGTNKSQLIPTIAIKGKSIFPASGSIQNFSTPINYTVTASDGTTRQYIIIVKTQEAPGTLFIGCSDNNFYALDALTGSLKWKFSGTQSFSYSDATYDNGVVFVGGIDAYVYAFNSVTGAVIWKFKAGESIESNAVVANGTVYVGSNDDNLYALDASTGILKWKFLTGGNVSSSPTVIDGTVIFGSSDGNLYALQASTGQLKWYYATGAMINQSSPCVANGTVFVGSRDGYLHAVDTNTGQLKWKYGTGGISLEQSSSTVTNGIVYIGGWYDVPAFSKKGSVYAINTTTGQLVWQSLPNSGFASSPAVSDGLLYIGCDDMNFYALDARSGTIAWKKDVVLTNGSSPTVANGIVYIGAGGNRYIFAFDAFTGTEKWRYPITNGLSTSSPLIIGASGDAHYPSSSGAQQ